jgi:hypothetical protein
MEAPIRVGLTWGTVGVGVAAALFVLVTMVNRAPPGPLSNALDATLQDFMLVAWPGSIGLMATDNAGPIFGVVAVAITIGTNFLLYAGVALLVTFVRRTASGRDNDADRL